MSREEHAREDLLADAKALVERASFRIPREPDEIVVGFRRDGSTSVYFGPERVYQFTSGGALRRAFVDDLLYKADRGRLVSLRRQRTPDAVELVRQELDPASTQLFLAQMRAHLATLHRALADGCFTLIGQVPPVSDVTARVRGWLNSLPSEIPLAASPRVR